MITAGAAGLVLLGCAVFFSGHSGANIEVQYEGVLADKNDVRTIRQIVSHERWAALGRAVRRRDARYLQESIRQLAYAFDTFSIDHSRARGCNAKNAF
jgi:hypothetical protein